MAAGPPPEWTVGQRAKYVEWARRVIANVRGVSPWLERQLTKRPLRLTEPSRPREFDRSLGRVGAASPANGRSERVEKILSEAWHRLDPNDQRFATLENMARHLLNLVEAGESDPNQLRASLQGLGRKQ